MRLERVLGVVRASRAREERLRSEIEIRGAMAKVVGGSNGPRRIAISDELGLEELDS